MILKKRLYKNKTFNLQKWHAVLGVVLAIPLIIIVLTGIPWSAFMGSHINKWGIPLHEGHLFGMPNKIINLLVCVGFLVAIVLGFSSWIRRSKNMSSYFPKRVNQPISISLTVLLCIMGIMMPLFGLSIICVLIFEYIYYFMKNR